MSHKNTARIIALPGMLKGASLAINPSNRIILPQEQGLRVVHVAEILYCQAQGNYVKIVLPQETILIAKTLKWIENYLPAYSFARCHGSYLVNLAHITFVGADFICIAGQARLPVSRSRHKCIVLMMKRFCLSPRTSKNTIVTDIK